MDGGVWEGEVRRAGPSFRRSRTCDASRITMGLLTQIFSVEQKYLRPGHEEKHRMTTSR
jgi:hypothetical protein